jgi:hypothetical protein
MEIYEEDWKNDMHGRGRHRLVEIPAKDPQASVNPLCSDCQRDRPDTIVQEDKAPAHASQFQECSLKQKFHGCCGVVTRLILT